MILCKMYLSNFIIYLTRTDYLIVKQSIIILIQLYFWLDLGIPFLMFLICENESTFKLLRIIKIFYLMNQDIDQTILLKYKPIAVIASGSLGKFWKVKSLYKNQFYILNKIQSAFDTYSDAQSTFKQIFYLSKIQHPNIMKITEVIKSIKEKDIYIVFQWMDTNLQYPLRGKILDSKHKRYILYQITLAIYYLHSVDLIHGNIKPQKIYLNEQCVTKIADFSLVRSIQKDQQQQPPPDSQYVADRWYKAPQLLLGSRQFSKAIDIWSFGCLFGEMMLNKPMFPGTSRLNQLQKIINWTGIPKKEDLKALKTDFGEQLINLFQKIQKIDHTDKFVNHSEESIHLLQLMLSFNPQKRPQIVQIIKHPYFKQWYDQSDLIKASPEIKICQNKQKISTNYYRKKILQFIETSYKQSSSKISTFISEKLKPSTTKDKKSHQKYLSNKKRTTTLTNEHKKTSKDKIIDKKFTSLKRKQQSKTKTIKTQQRQLNHQEPLNLFSKNVKNNQIQQKKHRKKSENIGKYMYKNRCF